MTNPLLADWTTPFGLPPFDVISDADFSPAVDTALTEARANIAAIVANDDPPDFANTIEALEMADALLSRVLGAFYNVAGADSNKDREAKELFARIEAIWDARDGLELTDEQQRVLMLTRRGFVRSGAQLEGDAAVQLREAKSRLSVLGTDFTQNLLADEREWFMVLGADDLRGLPDFVVATAKAAGEEKQAGGPVVTLSRSLIVPFLQFSERRDLRQKAYEAWTARGANGGATDNRAIAAETLKLREQRAGLLGYETFADFKLETEMAGTPGAVRDLLSRSGCQSLGTDVASRRLGWPARALGLAVLFGKTPQGIA